MANKSIENITPMSERSLDEAREYGRKGGIASGESRRKKKTAKEVVNMILNLKTTNADLQEKMREMGIEEDEMTNIASMSVAVMEKAIGGDYRSYNSLLEVAGEKVQEIKINTAIDDKVQKLEAMMDEIGQDT